MKRPLLVAGVFVVFAGTAGGDLLACGDKFLAISRGTRYQRATLPRSSASILLYASPKSSLMSALGTASMEQTLRGAGYRLTIVTTPDEFDRVSRSATWDLVLTDLAEGDTVRARVPSKGPIVLPVAFNASSDELKRAKKDYQRVVKAPTRKQSLLDVIDDVLILRGVF